MKTIKELVIKKFFGSNIVLTGAEQSPIIDYTIELTKKDVLKLIDELIKRDGYNYLLEELKSKIQGK